jgi:hypothetical protein
MSGPPISAGNERAAVIRLWCLKAPRPSSLRVYGRDGREHDVEIKPGTSWSDAAVSISALDPERLEAYTLDGKLIRAVPVADLIRKEETQQQQQAATFSAMSTTDPETQRMIVFAELLERAYAKAYDSSQQTVQVAFTQLQEICGSLAEQASASHAAANELSMGIRNLLVQQANEAIETATTPETSPMEQLAANFLSGQQMAKVEQGAATTNGAPKNGKPNGKQQHS